ncbi:MAG: hypothetical protein WAW33_02285 [Minisyncoccia bacterium]
MEEKDLIEQLKALKSIKPDEHWVFATKMSLMGQIVAKERDLNPTFASFLGSRSMKLTYSLVVLAMSLGGFTAFAKNALPGNPLYALKLSAQKAMIAVVPQSQKTNLKLSFAQDKILNLQKVKNSQMAEVLAQGIASDLNDISVNIQNEKNPEIALSTSKSVKTQTEKMRYSLTTAPSKSQEAAVKIAETINQTDAQVNAIIIASENKINNCPTYISEQLNKIVEYLSTNTISQEEKDKIAIKITEANGNLTNKNCLGALINLDEINKQFVVEPSKE